MDLLVTGGMKQHPIARTVCPSVRAPHEVVAVPPYAGKQIFQGMGKKS
jgi:hypothetical protein